MFWSAALVRPLPLFLTIQRLAAGARGGFLKDAAVLTAGNAVSQAIWIGSAPILTRIYEPDAFGV